MSKPVASESNEDYESRKTSRKRGAEDEVKENEEVIIEVTPAESLTISTTVSTAPPSWITKLRKSELRAELSDRSVKFEKKDNKSVLIELLRLDALARARTPPLNADIISHICTFFGDNRTTFFGDIENNENLRRAAQKSIAFRDVARRHKKQLVRNAEFETRVKEWLGDRAAAEEQHGPISGWAFSSVTNMWGLLFYMSARGHVEVAKLLLTAKDTNVNKIVSDGFSSLNIASVMGKPEVMKLLLAAEGIEVNKVSDKGFTSLHHASTEEQVEAVKLLLADERVDVIG